MPTVITCDHPLVQHKLTLMRRQETSTRKLISPLFSTKMTSTPKERIDWKIRPATLEDQDGVNQLLMDSYKHLLAADYEADFLEVALPLITQGREELLTCGTWYVVQDPRDDNLVGCGGWTFRQPAQTDLKVPHLRHFATRADRTRMGIGKVIWNKSWQEIQNQSADGANTILEVSRREICIFL